MHNPWYSAWCSFWEMRELCVYGNPRSNERMWFGGLIPFPLTQDTNVTGHQADFRIYFINGWVPSNLSSNRDIHSLRANCPGEYRFDLKPNGITYSKFIFRRWYVLEKIWSLSSRPWMVICPTAESSACWAHAAPAGQKDSAPETMGGGE